jgi:hypothetical protein
MLRIGARRLTAARQVAPFSKSGGLADVCDKLGVSLPPAPLLAARAVP